MINFQFDLVFENAVSLLDRQLSRVFGGVSLLNGERNAVHFVIPHVLGLHVQAGHFVRIVNIDLGISSQRREIQKYFAGGIMKRLYKAD